MARPARQLLPDHTYHITVRCNNRRFNLNRPNCREVLLFAINSAKQKFSFRLFALCIMSNHVHYLLEPQQPEDLPRIMHWINWYTAMCFNRMLNRTGHFWEQRYFSNAFPTSDNRRALNTLRYIHANPKAAKMRKGFVYAFGNYRTYADLSDDRLTEWHPAFLTMGQSLDECAARYRAFCRRYIATHKSGGRQSNWGTRQFPDNNKSRYMARSAQKQPELWQRCQVTTAFPGLEQAYQVSNRFISANSAPFCE